MRAWILPTVAALALVVTGCVTVSDIERLGQIQESTFLELSAVQVEYQKKVEAALNEAALSDDARLQEIKEAAQVRNQALEEIAKLAGASVSQLVDVIERRTLATIEGVGTLTGNPLIDMLLSVLGASGLGVFGANKIRDHRRALRGEPVALTHQTPHHES